MLNRRRGLMSGEVIAPPKPENWTRAATLNSGAVYTVAEPGWVRIVLRGAGGDGVLKLLTVEAVKDRFILAYILAEQILKTAPEDFFIGLATIVSHHGFRAFPDGGNQLLRIIAMGR